MYVSRDARRASSVGASRGCCHPTNRRPVLDMIEVSERTRSRKCSAIVCAIIPPMETPTTWARSWPRWSSSGDPVVGHVDAGCTAARLGRPRAAWTICRWVTRPRARLDRPVSRLS